MPNDMNSAFAPESFAPPTKPRRRPSMLAIYSVVLTLFVVGVVGWYIWQNHSTATCPMPKTIQYSYDDPRDYLGPFLSALTSHDSSIVRRYYVKDISITDKQTLESALSTYRSVPLAIDGWEGSAALLPWSDIANRPSAGKTTRLTWTTKKIDGCWRVQRVDTQTISN